MNDERKDGELIKSVMSTETDLLETLQKMKAENYEITVLLERIIFKDKFKKMQAKQYLEAMDHCIHNLENVIYKNREEMRK